MVLRGGDGALAEPKGRFGRKSNLSTGLKTNPRLGFGLIILKLSTLSTGLIIMLYKLVMLRAFLASITDCKIT